MQFERGVRQVGVVGLLFSLMLLAACGSNPPSRYQQAQDSAPRYQKNVGAVADAVPKVEPRSRGGNKSPYRVFGKQYWVLPNSVGYTATGTASWYGSKFHGHLTSNGETYNMYSMTAAHKSLPIPTYLKVTNLNNGRHVIVRVNDRGPFHGNRLLDLSYAAATKLGYQKQGTAPVRIEAIDPLTWNRAQPKPASIVAQKVLPATTPVVAANTPQTFALSAVPVSTDTDQIFIQVGAFSNFDAARDLKRRLQGVTSEPVKVFLDQQYTPNLHKVQVGPVEDMAVAQQVREIISNNGLGAGLILALPKL
ncbi:MAG: septal ring lytic transglycosylase RlpA family protein [Pseudomonadales bacterium]